MTTSTTRRLSIRQHISELMDDPRLDPTEHAAALRGLRRVNAISRTSAVLYRPIRELALKTETGPLRVLDVGCGNGETVLALRSRAKREGLDVRIDGCDLSPRAVEFARALAASRRVDSQFFVWDALGTEPLPKYDIVCASLFLHHLDERGAELALARMKTAADRLVLVDDLIRGPMGYALAWIGCRILSRSRVVRFDGPASVENAFSMAEASTLAERAGLVGASIMRHWPERFLLTWARDARLES